MIRKLRLAMLAIAAIAFDVLSANEPVKINSKAAFAANRLPSAPFISGDDFRAICDHIVDETVESFEPEKVQQGDLIFVKIDYLDLFFKHCHPRIQSLYILITHNSDISIPSGTTVEMPVAKGYAQWLNDPKLCAWFSTNVDARHPKLFPIPIGLENARWGKKYPELLMLHRQTALAKNKLLYGNFSIFNNPALRQPLYDLFSAQPFCHMIAQPKNLNDYLTDVQQSKFILSPPGNGLDCHRTWEALYAGTYPIVLSSALDPLFHDLPVVIVHDWQEITQEFLEQKYIELQGDLRSLKSLQFSCWSNLIRDAQRRCRQNVSVIQMKSGGRFGDNLLALAHALYFAQQNSYELLYSPFPYSDQLALDTIAKKYVDGAEKFFERLIKYPGGSAVLPSDLRAQIRNLLFVIPYFPESCFEYTVSPQQNQFPVAWEDQKFKDALCKLVAPRNELNLIQPKKDKISVAVHARLGGGFDVIGPGTNEKLLRYKIPHEEYYIEQIRKMSELCGHAPLYVFLFTDDRDPKGLMDRFRQKIGIPSIEFDCRKEDNAHDKNVLEDFFSIAQFDCLIRSESCYSFMAEKIGDFSIVISPADPAPGSVIHEGLVNIRRAIPARRPRIAICYFGLTRSTKKVYQSHFLNIFHQLDRYGIAYDVFMHTWELSGKQRIWGKDIEAPVDYDEYQLLQPAHYQIDKQDEFTAQLDFGNYFYQGVWDACGEQGEWLPKLVLNHLCALESQKRATDMVLRSGNTYDLIMYVRPDVNIKEPLPVKEILKMQEHEIAIPDFAHGEGYNDRFAILPAAIAPLYAKRIDEIADFRKGHGRITSEKYVKFICDKYSFKIHPIKFNFDIIRPG